MSALSTSSYSRMKPVKILLLSLIVGMICGYLVPQIVRLTSLNRSLLAILCISNAVALGVVNLFTVKSKKAKVLSLVLPLGICTLVSVLYPNVRGWVSAAIIFVMPGIIIGAIAGWEFPHPKALDVGIRSGLIGGVLSFFAFVPAHRIQASSAPNIFELMFFISITLTTLITQYSIAIGISCISEHATADTHKSERTSVS